MINLEELIQDPDFCKSFKIIRRNPKNWEKGELATEEKIIEVVGHVAPTNSKDIELLPEGDRVNGMKSFYTDSKTQLYITNTETISDICVYKRQHYKLIKVFDYSEHGFYKAIGTLTGEDDEI